MSKIVDPNAEQKRLKKKTASQPALARPADVQLNESGMFT